MNVRKKICCCIRAIPFKIIGRAEVPKYTLLNFQMQQINGNSGMQHICETNWFSVINLGRDVMLFLSVITSVQCCLLFISYL